MFCPRLIYVSAVQLSGCTSFSRVTMTWGPVIKCSLRYVLSAADIRLCCTAGGLNFIPYDDDMGSCNKILFEICFVRGWYVSLLFSVQLAVWTLPRVTMTCGPVIKFSLKYVSSAADICLCLHFIQCDYDMRSCCFVRCSYSYCMSLCCFKARDDDMLFVILYNKVIKNTFLRGWYMSLKYNQWVQLHSFKRWYCLVCGTEVKKRRKWILYFSHRLICVSALHPFKNCSEKVNIIKFNNSQLIRSN